jgi:RNA polymerase-binding transcription factor
MKKAERKKFEQRLLQLREGLTRNYQETALDSKSDMDDGTQDYIDFATRSYTKEFLLSLGNLERQQLQQVEEALRRVRTESFGTCVSCGEEISRKRLAAAPWVEYCLSCQEEQERGRAHAGRAFNILEEEPEFSGEE